MKNILRSAIVVEVAFGAFTPALAAEDMDAGSVLAGFGLLALLLCLYFLPTIIAGKRGVNAGFALFFVNLFVGWTVVGWIVCLIWAASGATRAQDAFYRNANGPFNRPVRPADSETIYQEAYAKERARLDHEATTKS
jgi:hypothetical protein